MTKPFTSQNPKEFAQLLQLYIDREPKTVLEIGTHEGGTLYYWLKCATQGARVGSIDIQRVQPERYGEWCAPGVQIDYYTGESQTPGALDFALNYFGGDYSVDWLFIDGGHSFEEVKYDWEVYAPLVKNGGVIALHDICSYPPFNSDVDLFWAQLKRKFPTKHTEFIERNEEGFLGPGIGVIFL